MQRLPELDALRGIAAVVIMMFHLRFMGRHPRWGSGFDIDVFFVLSGYLITSSILHGSRATNFLRVFYFRRALRIWPIYFLVLALCWLSNPLLPKPDSLRDAVSYLTFTQNIPEYWHGEPSYFSRHFQHTWTLAIEEHFYLFWPFLVHRLGARRLTWAIAALLPIPVVMRSIGFQGHILLTRCDSLLLGSLLAALLDDKERLRRHATAYRVIFTTIGLASFSVPFWRDPLLEPWRRAWPGLKWDQLLFGVETFRVGVADFALIGLVVCLAGSRWLAPLRGKVPCYVGRISYSLFMYHPIVFGMVVLMHTRLGFRPSVWMDLVKAIACFAVAALSWHFIERPSMAFKDRFPYRLDPAANAAHRADAGHEAVPAGLHSAEPSRSTLATPSSGTGGPIGGPRV